MILTGTAIAGRSAQKVEAELHLGEDGSLHLDAADQVVIEHVRHVELTEALGSIPRSITFSTGWTFTPGDSSNSAKLNDWLKTHKGSPFLHKLESHLGLIFAALLITIATSYWVIVDGFPLLSRAIANSLPEAVYESVGESTTEYFDYFGFQPSELSEERLQELLALFNSLDALEKDYPITPRLFVRSWQGGINAFALADGTVVMTDQMVNAAESDLEIASVLLHELGHVYHNDVMAQLVRASIMSVVTAYVVGDVSGIGDTLVGSAALGLTLSYSREAESRADEFALAEMTAQFGTVEPMKIMFERLQGEVTEIPEWLSSHPGMVERIERIETYDPKQEGLFSEE